MRVLLVALGGALGALLRYWIAIPVQAATASAFPWGTTVVNLLGCLVIGLCWGVAAGHPWPPGVMLFFFVGLLGAFTTFSTFALDALNLLNAGAVASAVLYVLLSNAGGLLLAFFGYGLGRTV